MSFTQAYYIVTCTLCICLAGSIAFLWLRRLPELTPARDRDHSSSSQHHMQPQHPQASESPQGQQLVEKLQGDGASTRAVTTAPADDKTAPADDKTALAADSQRHSDHQPDRRPHTGPHAHFADEFVGKLDDVDTADNVTGRNESITAVRGGAAGPSHAEGTFWARLDAEGAYTSASGLLSLQSLLVFSSSITVYAPCKACMIPGADAPSWGRA